MVRCNLEFRAENISAQLLEKWVKENNFKLDSVRYGKINTSKKTKGGGIFLSFYKKDLRAEFRIFEKNQDGIQDKTIATIISKWISFLEKLETVKNIEWEFLLGGLNNVEETDLMNIIEKERKEIFNLIGFNIEEFYLSFNELVIRGYSNTKDLDKTFKILKSIHKKIKDFLTVKSL